jgi:hypothetical protein
MSATEETSAAILQQVTAINGHMSDVHDVVIICACLLVINAIGLVALSVRRFRS